MFKRMIAAVAIFMAMLFLTLNGMAAEPARNFDAANNEPSAETVGTNSSEVQEQIPLAEAESTPKSRRDFYNSLLREKIESGEQTFSRNDASNKDKDSSSADINAVNPSEPQGVVSDLSSLGFQKLKVKIDGNTFSVKLSPEQMDSISAVRAQLVWFDSYENENGDENAAMLFLGGDTGIEADWNAGEFKSTFDGKWITIDGNPVFVYVSSENTEIDENGIKRGSELYAIPVNLNCRQCNLMIACSYPDETFRIIGARPELNEGIPTGELYALQKGDVVKPLFMGLSISEEETEKLSEKYPDPTDLTDEEKIAFAKELSEAGKLGLVEGKGFTIGETIAIERRPLLDGKYAYAFEFVNPFGGLNDNSALNAVFAMRNGEIAAVTDADSIDDPSELDDMADSRTVPVSLKAQE